MLLEEINPKLQGLDAFEKTMGTLGLSERRPVPDIVTFDEPDPLGAAVVAARIIGPDMAASTSKIYFNRNSSSSAFSLFGVGASSFQTPRSPVLCFFYLYLFLLHLFSYNITPPQFWYSYPPHLRCPPTSMFSLLHLALSFSLHLLLTISVSLLELCHLCHTCPCSYFFIPDLLCNVICFNIDRTNVYNRTNQHQICTTT